jgi:MFS family permease
MLGAFRTISAEATPEHRASLIAAYFIVSCAAFSIPVVAAGVITTHVGLHRTALGYCATIAVLAAAAASPIFLSRFTAPRDPAAQAGETGRQGARDERTTEHHPG